MSRSRMNMFTKAGVLVALLAVASVTARPSGDDPKDDEAPRFTRTTSYHGANTRLTSEDNVFQKADVAGRQNPSTVPIRKTKEDSNSDSSNSKTEAYLKIIEPVLKHIQEHEPTESNSQLGGEHKPQPITVYNQQPGTNSISQYSNVVSDGYNNSPIFAAIRNYENPVTSYLKNNPLDSRQGLKNSDNYSQIRRQIIHQQTIVAPYSQYYQQASSNMNNAGYLVVSPTIVPQQQNGGYQQNRPIYGQQFVNNPSAVGSSVDNNQPQVSNGLTGLYNSVASGSKDKPVLNQNIQVNSNTLPLVRPNSQNAQDNNFNKDSRTGSSASNFALYDTFNAQPQQFSFVPSNVDMSPNAGITFRQNYQNQNYGTLNSNVNNRFTIMQPPSIEFTSNSGANTYLSSPSYLHSRDWRPNQPTNNAQNINSYANYGNQNSQQDANSRQLQFTIPWPFAQYFPIVIKDPLVSMMSGFTSMIEYGPEADVCKPLNGKTEGNQEAGFDSVTDNVDKVDEETSKDLKLRSKRLLEAEEIKVKEVGVQNKPKGKVEHALALTESKEKGQEKIKTSSIINDAAVASLEKNHEVKSTIQKHQSIENHSPNVQVSRSVELDVTRIFNQDRIHQLGIHLPQEQQLSLAPQVAETKTIETHIKGDTTSMTEQERRNVKDEFEIINVNLPKQDGGIFQGRQDVPHVVDKDVEIINVNQQPVNTVPVAPKLLPEGKISDEVELIDVSSLNQKNTGSMMKSPQIESLDAKREISKPTPSITEQSSANLKVLQDEEKETQEGENEKEPEDEEEDEEEEAEDEDSEEDEGNKPDIEVQTEPPTNDTGVNKDPKEEEPGVVLTTGSHGNYGPVIRRLVVRKGGVAIAGPGGIATAGPGGVAVVGPGGTAYTRPNGVAIVGPGGKVVGLPNDMVFQHGGIAVIHRDGSEPRMETVTTDRNGLPPGARVLAYGPTVYFHPPDLVF